MWRATVIERMESINADISILALVWRATNSQLMKEKSIGISILALVWRATSLYILTFVLNSHFNPRPRVEGDYDAYAIRTDNHNFNPRPRVEGDIIHHEFLTPKN